MRAESGGEFERGAPHCRVSRGLWHAVRDEGGYSPAAVIIMSHVATKPFVRVSIDPKKARAVRIIDRILGSYQVN